MQSQDNKDWNSKMPTQVKQNIKGNEDGTHLLRFSGHTGRQCKPTASAVEEQAPPAKDIPSKP